MEFGTGSTIPARWPPAGVRSAAPGTTLAVPAATALDAWVGDYYLQSSGAMATNALGWLLTMSARTASGFRATV
ncbi:MAG: hypothetical protein ACLUQH_10950 [Collinsella sp.]